jgi:hypothetical protein
MGRQFLKYSFGAIALYLVVANAGAGQAITAGASGVGTVVRNFQGRK